MKQFDVSTFDVGAYDAILERGLSYGLGTRDGKMCIEAAICTVLGLDHGDEPQCVAISVRVYKIRLNDSAWSSEKARSKGLRDLGIAQLGSLGVVDDRKFAARMAEKTIRLLIPQLFREVFSDNPACLEAASMCEKEGTARAAADAAARAATRAADAATRAADAAADADKYLLLSARIALDVLRELNSPGVALL